MYLEQETAVGTSFQLTPTVRPKYVCFKNWEPLCN